MPHVFPTSCAQCSFAVCTSWAGGTDELFQGYNHSGLKNQVILLLLTRYFSLGFSRLFKRQSHRLSFHCLCSSWMYMYVYIAVIYSCLYMWSLCFPANCCHKALGWTVLRKDCSLENLLPNMKLQPCRKMSAFPDLVLMIKQEEEVASI